MEPTTAHTRNSSRAKVMLAPLGDFSLLLNVCTALRTVTPPDSALGDIIPYTEHRIIPQQNAIRKVENCLDLLVIFHLLLLTSGFFLRAGCCHPEGLMVQ
jgi:hypothetical protein